MRACDMPEDEWQAYQQRLADTFERVDAINADLAERRADGIDERYTQREPEREPEPAPVIGRNWAQEQRRIEASIDQRVGTATRKWADARLRGFAEGLGEELAKIEREQLARMRQEFEDRIAKSDAATVELLLQLERKVADLELRVAPQSGPLRLISGGGSDAA